MKKLFIILTAILFGVLDSSAATPTAAKVVEKAVATLSSAPSATADFTLKQGGTLDKGKLVISRNKFKLSLPGMESWFDGKNLWSYSEQAGEVNLTAPTAHELAEINPLTYLDMAAKSFNCRRLQSTSAESDVIEMTPKVQKGSNIKKVVAHLSTKTSLPQKLIVYPTGNNTPVTIDIASLTIGKKLAESVFKFSPLKLPGVEVIDLR